MIREYIDIIIALSMHQQRLVDARDKTATKQVARYNYLCGQIAALSDAKEIITRLAEGLIIPDAKNIELKTKRKATTN